MCERHRYSRPICPECGTMEPTEVLPDGVPDVQEEGLTIEWPYKCRKCDQEFIVVYELMDIHKV